MNFQDRKITARVEKVVYPKDALDGTPSFYIIRCDVGTVMGKLAHVPKKDERLTLEGKWEVSDFNGKPEFRFFRASVFIPADERAILRYACEMTKGFGEAAADAIWRAKGDKWREVSLSDGVKGLTDAKLAALHKTIAFITENATKVKSVAWLCSVGCTLRMAESAFDKWGLQTVERVKANCYILAQLPNYGFADVDSHIRAYFGIGRNDARRIKACLLYYAAQLTQENTVVAWDELYAKVSAAIDADAKEISGVCRGLFADGKLVAFPETMMVASARDYKAESAIWDFVQNSHAMPHMKVRQPVGSSFRLDDSQASAVQYALDNSFAIINGGAGCGKTTLVKSICDSLGRNVELCAFAGKAAARLKEATAHDACTIHRMLNYMGEEQGFARKSLEGSTVILDEASMVSSDLMAEIVKRNPDRLILVGDEAQLPPVGSGQPFHDLIALKPDAVCTLTTCYRNKEAIFSAARAIREGFTPPPEEVSERERYDFVRIATENNGQVVERILNADVDFNKDIVLCCRNGEKDDAGCTVMGLNAAIKKRVNPPRRGALDIEEGDRIICTKNCPALDVWNGTTGSCRDFDTAGAMWVDLDFPNSEGEREVLIPRKQVKEWQLAYALTVHKSQGSQYRKVFFIVTKNDMYELLSRPMAYTAVTRAKNECHVMGDLGAFSRAIGTVSHKMTVMQEISKQ